MEYGLDFYALMTLAAFFAGGIDAIAGGGGLIILPLMFLGGLDPVAAVATNKLQSTFGAIASTLSFTRAGHVELRRHAPLAIVAAGSAAIGAILVQLVSSAWLQGLMPLLLIVIALYFAFSAAIRDLAVPGRWPVKRFMLTVVPLVGAYDGFFGPGAGSFYMLGIALLLGFAAVPATGLTKYLNLASNAGALLLFILSGKIIWSLGLVMALGNVAGARIGARLAIRNGARLIRPLLVVISIAMALRLLLNPANPLRVALSSAFGG